MMLCTRNANPASGTGKHWAHAAVSKPPTAFPGHYTRPPPDLLSSLWPHPHPPQPGSESAPSIRGWVSSLLPKPSVTEASMHGLQCPRWSVSSLPHSLIHLLTDSLTSSLIHLPIHSLIHLFTLSFTHSFTHTLAHSLIHPHTFTSSFIRSLTHPFTHSLTHRIDTASLVCSRLCASPRQSPSLCPSGAGETYRRKDLEEMISELKSER